MANQGKWLNVHLEAQKSLHDETVEDIIEERTLPGSGTDREIKRNAKIGSCKEFKDMAPVTV